MWKSESHSELHGIKGKSIYLLRERNGNLGGKENQSDLGLLVFQTLVFLLEPVRNIRINNAQKGEGLIKHNKEW